MVFIEFMPTEYMDFTLARFLSNTGITYLLFIIAILLSSLYPALRSARTQPAEALHYE
jgi:ABC-type transport system, involved in lipoprotein release, permease component